MDNQDAFARACTIAHDHGKTAMDVVAQNIESSVHSGDAAEAKLWSKVGETLSQVDRIASCRFTLSSLRSRLLDLEQYGRPR